MEAKTRHLLYDEARALGLAPYAVYGGKVYSVLVPRMYSSAKPHVVPHGSEQYAAWVADADARLSRVEQTGKRDE